MPTKLCLARENGRGCGNPAVYRGRCQRHARERERETHSPEHKRIYNSRKWKMTRRRILIEQPLCQWPGEEGHAIASDIDHIVPLDKGGNPWARSNLQPLCRKHHGMKTREERA